MGKLTTHFDSFRLGHGFKFANCNKLLDWVRGNLPTSEVEQAIRMVKE